MAARFIAAGLEPPPLPPPAPPPSGPNLSQAEPNTPISMVPSGARPVSPSSSASPLVPGGEEGGQPAGRIDWVRGSYQPTHHDAKGLRRTLV